MQICKLCWQCCKVTDFKRVSALLLLYHRLCPNARFTLSLPVAARSFTAITGLAPSRFLARTAMLLLVSLACGRLLARGAMFTRRATIYGCRLLRSLLLR